MENKLNNLKPPPLPDKVHKMVIGTKVCLFQKVSETTVLNVVTPQYKVLLGRKQTDTLWGFPGGKCDPDETFEQTCIREMKEETNVCLEENNLHYLKSFLMKKQGETQSRLYILFAAPLKGAFKAGDDIVELRLFPLEDLDNVLLLAHKPMGKEVKNYLYNEGNQYISLDSLLEE